MKEKNKILLAVTWGFGLFFALLYALAVSAPALPDAAEPIRLYSSVQRDELRDLMIQALEASESEIFLVVYGLSDPYLIAALNRRAEAGVKVTVIVDAQASGSQRKMLSPKVQFISRRSLGLMHLKILTCDHSLVFLGSANFTSESLRAHSNLVLGFFSPELASTLKRRLTCEPTLDTPQLFLARQSLELWLLPEQEGALERLIGLIDAAQSSVRVAMYTWTHPSLTQAVIRAHQRGVSVELVLDRSSCQGSNRPSLISLLQAGIPTRVNSGQALLHDKLLIVDQETLVTGSCNWTRSAFTRNNDCFVILDQLSASQKDALSKLWKKIQVESSSPAVLDLAQF